MANPFEKRATEYLRDDEAFLSVVTPEPLVTFFKKPADQDKLYDRLTIVIGTPGSGKTTLARLFQFSTLSTLLKNTNLPNYKPLLDTLTLCGVIEDGEPKILGGRVPLESEYREFWEFPYPDELKFGLMTTLLQARAVLMWLRNIQAADITIDQIEIVPRPEAEAALISIGGTNARDVLARAREIELAIYNISAALIPPDIKDIDDEAVVAYRPFDVIESIKIVRSDKTYLLRPLVIFDDAHSLHQTQFEYLKRWLSRRELKVARWILTRLDALTPEDVLLDKISEDPEKPGLKITREITVIRMQSGGERGANRKAFRKMAKDMTRRYLAQMDVFSRRQLGSLSDLLSTISDPINSSKILELESKLNSTQKDLLITASRRELLLAEVEDYFPKNSIVEDDVKLATLSILMNRYAKRIPQRGLFDSELEDLEPRRPLSVDALVYDGAKVHLMQNYERPYFYGIDDLCDAGSENVEQFLQLTSRIVSQLETRLIRGRNAMLSVRDQDKLLRQRSKQMIDEWDFPHHQSVKRLADGIARECIGKSMEPNASLGGGAVAFGILQSDFKKLTINNQDLAQVLKFGTAYNAFIIKPNYGTKKQVWCLLELSGILRLHYGLTLKNGGFLERTPTDLNSILQGE